MLGFQIEVARHDVWLRNRPQLPAAPITEVTEYVLRRVIFQVECSSHHYPAKMWLRGSGSLATWQLQRQGMLDGGIPAPLRATDNMAAFPGECEHGLTGRWRVTIYQQVGNALPMPVADQRPDHAPQVIARDKGPQF